VQKRAGLEELLAGENYFRLRDHYARYRDKLSDKDRKYFAALIHNAFYRHAESNRAIDELLGEKGYTLTGEEMQNLYKARMMNHYNLFDYGEALASCAVLVADYENLMDSSAYAYLLNEQKMLRVIRNVPPQEVVKTADSRIPLRRDKMGLLNIALDMGGDSLDFLFDTGSSFSFMRRSVAERADLPVYNVDFEVEGATGRSVVCDVTVMDQFSIGNVTVKNAVFWVFDDQDVTLPEYDYSVNGAIAFPILRSMEEIHIVFNDTLFIPRIAETYDHGNLAITDLDPVIAVLQDGDTLPFFYDTGAAFTSFYKPFYDDNAAMIASTYDQKAFSIGSLGGVEEFECYIIDSMELTIAGSKAMIYDIEAHTDFIYKDPEKVYGNLGQDYLLQFEKMVISTKYASVFLE